MGTKYCRKNKKNKKKTEKSETKTKKQPNENNIKSSTENTTLNRNQITKKKKGWIYAIQEIIRPTYERRYLKQYLFVKIHYQPTKERPYCAIEEQWNNYLMKTKREWLSSHNNKIVTLFLGKVY